MSQSQQRDLTVGDLSLEAQAELVKDIKKNVASLKLSIDQILVDMDSIRNAKLEILNKVSSVKNENVVNSAQLQVTLVKATRIIKKSEDNRRKLELVLKKMNDFNVVHALTNVAGSEKPDEHHVKRCEKTTNNNNNNTSSGAVVPFGKEKIRLHLLDNNKYLLSTVEPQDELGKMKTNFKWGKDSALKELQWIVKMKLYKLRHNYDKLLYDQDLEERTPLPVSWLPVRRSSEQA